jgi:hypothetical protein
MIAKSHHIVPRLHLENFVGTEPAGQVWTYDALGGKQWPQRPLEAGTQTHFYSFRREDGTNDTRIEEMLGTFESNAAPVYESLLRGNIPDIGTQERVWFAEFLAIMFVRTPGARRRYAEIESCLLQTKLFSYAQNPKAFEKMVHALEKERGKPFDLETLEEVRRSMLQPGAYEILIPKERTFSALSAADDLAPIFHNMTWSLAYPMDGYFITGDNPVALTTDPGARHPAMGQSFKNRTAETSFPLSSSVMLLTSWDRDALTHGLYEKKHVDLLNELRAARSDRYLYAHCNDDEIATLAKNFRNERPEIASSGYGPPTFAPTRVGR